MTYIWKTNLLTCEIIITTIHKSDDDRVLKDITYMFINGNMYLYFKKLFRYLSPMKLIFHEPTPLATIGVQPDEYSLILLSEEGPMYRSMCTDCAHHSSSACTTHSNGAIRVTHEEHGTVS